MLCYWYISNWNLANFLYRYNPMSSKAKNSPFYLTYVLPTDWLISKQEEKKLKAPPLAVLIEHRSYGGYRTFGCSFFIWPILNCVLSISDIHNKKDPNDNDDAVSDLPETPEDGGAAAKVVAELDKTLEQREGEEVPATSCHLKEWSPSSGNYLF